MRLETYILVVIECNRCLELKETWWLPRTRMYTCVRVCGWVGASPAGTRTQLQVYLHLLEIGYALQCARELKAWPRKPYQHASDKVS